MKVLMPLIIIFQLFASASMLSAQSTIEIKLKSAIDQLQEETGYRFLYREALVRYIKLSSAPVTIPEFEALIQPFNLGLRVDEKNMQVVLFSIAGQIQQNGYFNAVIIDHITGERLPYAYVLIESDIGPRRVLQSDLSGILSVPLDSRNQFTVRVQYVSYESVELEFDSAILKRDTQVPISLIPAALSTGEIIITASVFSSQSDSLYRNLINSGTFNAAGEANSIRMLQQLPSVYSTTASSAGAGIRGSNADALQVLLDGTPIYNHSHLFGMVDSFNPDAIRTSQFFYDITPATYQAPPGGTLDLVTRTGSLNKFSATAGLSNTAVSATLEGPLKTGRSSWLISGRHSILNNVNLFNSSTLVAWGLDIDRKNSVTENGITTTTDRTVIPGDFDAAFYDVHAKFYIENKDYSRWIAGVYFGGDDTNQESERLTRVFTGNPPRPTLQYNTYQTKNNWGNRSFNLQHFNRINRNSFFEFKSGFSYYYTSYLKEDFRYNRVADQNGNTIILVQPFSNESELSHFFINPQLQNGDFTYGFTWNVIIADYAERSFNRPEFIQKNSTHLSEIYLQHEYKLVDILKAENGIRIHHYSNGNYFRTSPRIRFTAEPHRRISLSAGYSRNHQFLYRIGFYNQTTSEIWITANDNQPPSVTDQFTAGLYIDLWRGAGFQAEAYLKRQDKLRYHEINIQAMQNTNPENPWFVDFQGFSQGVELLFSQRLGRAAISQSYTLSESKLNSSRLNNGEWFFAEWDRRHQLITTFSYSPIQGIQLNASFTFATGVPDRQSLFTGSGMDRLDDYLRTDISVDYSVNLGSTGKLAFQFGVFNLFDRRNVWYREAVQIVNDSGPRPVLEPAMADVYDLGFRPSFSVSLRL